MATLNGKKLTAAQLSALEKKWNREDEKFWKAQNKKYIDREKMHIAKLRKLPKTALRDRLIAKHTAELKRLSALKK